MCKQSGRAITAETLESRLKSSAYKARPVHIFLGNGKSAKPQQVIVDDSKKEINIICTLENRFIYQARKLREESVT